MSKKRGIVYCTYCGTENKKTEIKCCKCNKELLAKDNLAVDHLKKKAIGKVQDDLLSGFLSFIKSHLYGTVLTFSVIISATIIAIVNMSNSYEIVTEKPEYAMVCTPKKFDRNYSFVYQTEDECMHKGNNDFLYVTDNINPEIFTYSCEAKKDECGTTWYIVVFNTWDNETQTAIPNYY